MVTLPGEVRLDRDDVMSICICDEAFRRRPTDEQPQTHALYVSKPEWRYPDLRSGRPANWPAGNWHEDYFPRDADDDAYAEAHPTRTATRTADGPRVTWSCPTRDVPA